jgi:hypothetical protein
MKISNFIEIMRHSPIGNYGGIPGLTSWLIGAPSSSGLVRLMECSRDHQEPIIPHSHRFDFHCLVLAGEVRNVLWTQMQYNDVSADLFWSSVLKFKGLPGQYETHFSSVYRWKPTYYEYHEGDEYNMKSDEVHSIFFSRGTSVLFFEGPQTTNESIILEPFVDGKHVPTFKVEPWMFNKS